MRLRRLLAVSALAITCATAQDATPDNAPSDPGAASQAGDANLARSIRAVADRIAAIVQVSRVPNVVAVRSDEAKRDAEAKARAQRLLPQDIAAARGRAWVDLGFGSGVEPQVLVEAIARDLPGMTFDATRERLLVDPERMLPDSGHGDPEVDPDASILLATGVAPDEPTAGHYLTHAILDGPSPDGPVTTDALLARSALAEGAANLAALTLLFGGVGLESEVVAGSLRPEEVMGGRLVPDALRTAPPVVSGLLQFVYLDGFAQAATIARKGGFGRLAQERRSRLTTRDVIHVDRAPAPPTEMAKPALPVSSTLLPVDHDSLGEQGIVALVSLLTGKDNLGLIAGDGWVADALWRFEPGPGTPPKPGDGATIWLSRWSTNEDAADFSYGLERSLQARFPGETLAVDPAGGGQVLRRADRTYRIERSGTQVTFRVTTPGAEAKPAPAPKKKGPPSRSIPSKN